MAYLAPRPNQMEEQFSRLLREKLAGDESAVEQVQALIQSLRGKQHAALWESAPPERCDHGRIPHC